METHEGEHRGAVDRWTHLAITWDQAKKRVGIYVDGRHGPREARRASPMGCWEAGRACCGWEGTRGSRRPNLSGLLDEVRVSSVVESTSLCQGQRSWGATPAAGPMPTQEAGPIEVRLPWGMTTDPTECAKVHVQKDHRGNAESTKWFQGGTMDRPQLPHADGGRE